MQLAVGALVLAIAVMMALIKRRPGHDHNNVVSGATSAIAHRMADITAFGCPNAQCNCFRGDVTERRPETHPIWGMWVCETCGLHVVVTWDNGMSGGSVYFPPFQPQVVEVVPHPKARRPAMVTEDQWRTAHTPPTSSARLN